MDKKKLDMLEKLIIEVSEMPNPCNDCKYKTITCWIVGCEDFGDYTHAQDKLYQLKKKYE